MTIEMKKGTHIFKVALSIYLVTMMFDVSMFGYMELFSTILKGLRYFSYLLLVWKIIADGRFTSGQLVRYGICILLSLISCLVTGSRIFIFLSLFLIAVSDVYFHEILRISLWTNGICLAVIGLLGRLRVVPDRYVYGERERHSYGFNFPTTASNYWMYFVLLYICYRKKKMTLLEYMLLGGVTCYFFAISDTRNAFLVTTIALVLSGALKIWREKKGRYIFDFLIRNMVWIGTVLISMLIFFYDKVKVISETIDMALSSRIKLSCDAIQDYGIHLFGQYIEWVGGTNSYEVEWRDYNYVDSSYIQILLSYGIVILLVLIVACYFLGREIVRAKDWYLGLAVVLVAVHSTFDPQFIWMQYNLFILALGYLMVPDRIMRREYLFGEPEQGGT